MNHPPGRYLENVLEQPAILRSLITQYQDFTWVDAFEACWKPQQQFPLLLTGMGASYSALWPLWFHLNRHGQTAQRIETSELIHYLPNVLARPGLCLVISQSGESAEIRRLMEQVQQNRAQGLKTPTIVSVSTAAGNHLSQHSDLALHTAAGSEVGVATKTFTSTLAILHLLSHCLTGQFSAGCFDELKQVADAQANILGRWTEWIAPAMNTFAKANTYALVGRGPSLAAVDDGALVLTESLRQMAHGFSGGEFRHGPMEMLTDALGVMVLNTPGSTLALNQRLSHDVAQRGGSLVTVGPGADLALPALPDVLMPMLEILPVQLLAHVQAQALGLVPGNFQWSGKVVLQE